jgi:type I restriction-modification system DNA methylase subunit
VEVEAAQTEAARKERLFRVLHTLFGETPTGAEALNEMSLGAERTILNVPVAHRSERGRADTQYRNVIIEFEKDLQRTADHAREQLAEYLGGNWRSGEPFHFVLIATDGVRWHIYAPRYKDFLAKDQALAQDYDLIRKETFELTETTLDEFYFFLDRTLFRTHKLKATLERIQQDFGQTSQTFITALGYLRRHYAAVKGDTHLQTAYDQWQTFLDIAYGKFQGTDDVFLIHTYLSVLTKILAYNLLTLQETISDAEMKTVLDGSVFRSRHLENFTDNDFYGWAAEARHFEGLKGAFRALAAQLSEYDFSAVDEDILKGVYQELIDIETRHALGEYYTPDWLCQRLVNHFATTPHTQWLDPSCGSGSFLRAAVIRMRHRHPELEPYEIAARVTGIDIHPLSVQVAKTTILLALGRDTIYRSRQPIPLQVYLANTVLTPRDSTELFGDKFVVQVDGRPHSILREAFEDPLVFDRAVRFCEQQAEFWLQNPAAGVPSVSAFGQGLHRRLEGARFSPALIENFYGIAQALHQAKAAGRDGIWKFILINNYKPFFLHRRFDYVIGNPPWLPFRDVDRLDYQNQLKALARKYSVAPSEHLITHLELAAIFWAHCANYFLKNDSGTGAQIAFVVPRSFLSSDHHDNTRAGRIHGVELTEIWDLKDVSPLFNVPSAVLIGRRRALGTIERTADAVLPRLCFTGKLPAQNLSHAEATPHLTETPTHWHYVHLGKRSAFDSTASKIHVGVNHYNQYFKNGATIFPRNFYFIELFQEHYEALKRHNSDIGNRYIVCKSSRDFQKEGKKPWKDLFIEGRLYTEFMFRTAVAKNVLPFALVDPPMVVLPMLVSPEGRPELLTTYQLFQEHAQVEVYEWFHQVEQLWNKHKTETAEKMTHLDRLNYQRGLTSQNLNTRLLVLYTASSKDANAVLVDAQSFDRRFVVENACFYYVPKSEAEGHYLTVFLNSGYANALMKPFQSAGLFGPRHVHKKILEVPLPEYDPGNAVHVRLSELGRQCAELAQPEAQALPRPLENVKLGAARLHLRKLLEPQLQEADKLLEQLCS